MWPLGPWTIQVRLAFSFQSAQQQPATEPPGLVISGHGEFAATVSTVGMLFTFISGGIFYIPLANMKRCEALAVGEWLLVAVAERISPGRRAHKLGKCVFLPCLLLLYLLNANWWRQPTSSSVSRKGWAMNISPPKYCGESGETRSRSLALLDRSSACTCKWSRADTAARFVLNAVHQFRYVKLSAFAYR